MKKETGTKAKRGKSRVKTVFQRKSSLLIMEHDAARRRRTHKHGHREGLKRLQT